jgi:hypothetical protein
MDYFNELLESYSLLKKRTFKLRFLTEQEEEQVNAQALAAARSLVSNPEGVGTGATSDQTAFKSQSKSVGASEVPYAYRNEKNEVIVQWTGFGRNTRVMVPNGNFDMMPEPQKGQLIGYFSDGQAANAAGEVGDSPESFAQAELAGTKFDIGDIKQRLHKIYLNYVKFCEADQTDRYQNKRKTTLVPDGEKQDIERKCYRSAFSKVYGKKPGGLANLLTSTKIQQQFIDPQGSGDPELEITLTEEASPALVIAALANIQLLFDFANDPSKFKDDPEICDKFSKSMALTTESKGENGKKIGKGGANRVIVYGFGSNEGIVIPAQSQDYKLAMSKASKRCEGEDAFKDGVFPKVDLRDLNTAALNAKKGTLHERLSSFLVDLHSLAGDGTKQQKSAVLQGFLAELQKAGEVAKYLKEAVVEDGVQRVATIDEALANELGIEEDELFQAQAKGDPLLKNFLLDYYKATKPFLEKVKPVALIHNGLASTTGGRADQFMVFKDSAGAKSASDKTKVNTYEMDREEFVKNSENPEATEAKLKAAGVTGDTVHVMEMGQKLYAKLKGGKIGEINKVRRLFDLVLSKLDKAAQKKDKHLDDDFMEALDNRFPLEASTEKTLAGLENALQTIDSYTNGDQKWTDEKGVEHTISSQADATVKHLLTSLRYDELTETEFGNLLKNYKGTDMDKQQLTVALQRLKMSSTFKELSKSKSGKQALLRMGFVCGGNARDMVQSIFTQDGKKNYNIAHNEIFNKFMAAGDNLQVKVDGYTVTFDDGNGFVGSLKTEYTSSKNKAEYDVRTLFDISKNTIEKLAGKKTPELDVAHSLETLFSVQNRLLETLLS